MVTEPQLVRLESGSALVFPTLDLFLVVTKVPLPKPSICHTDITLRYKIVIDTIHVNNYIVTMTIWSPQLPQTDGTLTQRLVEALRDDVRTGRLAQGERLPTHRELAEHLGIAIGTVTRVYAIAQREGLISGEIGRGTFVRPLQNEDSEHTGKDEVAGSIDLSKNRVARYSRDSMLGEGLAALISKPDLAFLLDTYQPAAGVPRHREVAADWLSRPGFAVRADQTLVCSGAQHALFVTLATITKPGDTLLAEQITYAGVRALASLLHLRLQGVAFDEYGLIPDAFETACISSGAKVLYCIPTLHNPTSAIMPAERRQQIAAIATRNGISIIEDDVYGFVPGELAPLPIAAYAPERTFYVNSTSKSIAPGLRIGYVVAPPDSVSRIANTIHSSTLEATPIMSELATIWIESGAAAETIKWKQEEIAARHALALSVLGDLGEVSKHPSCHIWLPLPEPWRSEDFVTQARNCLVIISPSEAFVVGRGSAPHAVRICLGAPSDRRQLEKGLEILAEILGNAPEPGFTTV